MHTIDRPQPPSFSANPQAWLKASDVLRSQVGSTEEAEKSAGSLSDSEHKRLLRAMVHLERAVMLFVPGKHFGDAGVALKTLGMASTLMNNITNAVKYVHIVVVAYDPSLI